MTTAQQTEYDYIVQERLGLGSTQREAEFVAMAWVMRIEWNNLPASPKANATSKAPAAPL
jgi:hypothetical protein